MTDIQVSVTWFLTLAVIIATGQAILYHKEPKFELVGASTALLFALPQIRASQPGIPDTPTISDGESRQISIEIFPLTDVRHQRSDIIGQLRYWG